jgi:hypothetical protein
MYTFFLNQPNLRITQHGRTWMFDLKKDDEDS